MTLDRDRPEILAPRAPPGLLHPADHHRPGRECNAKTAQKHDYPSAAWRRSYARRTGAERGFATAKDPAATDIARGWCRLMGLAPLMLFTTTLLIARNQRILRRLEHPAGRKPAPRRRRAAPENPQRRRKTLATLAAGAALTRNRRDHEPRARTTSQDTPATASRKHARHQTSHGTRPRRNARSTHGTGPPHQLHERQNVRPKRENGPH